MTAYQEGKDAGWAGKLVTDNPYPITTRRDEFRSWVMGWFDVHYDNHGFPDYGMSGEGAWVVSLESVQSCIGPFPTDEAATDFAIKSGRCWFASQLVRPEDFGA